MNENWKKTLNEELEKYSAAQVAEFFLSPFVEPKLLIELTREEGPLMWMVNRSDVYSETLEAVKTHPQSALAERAVQKLKIRHSSLLPYTSPEAPLVPLEEIEDYEIENFLGHPLCPPEIILFFTNHAQEDVRLSAALSFCRSYLEHPHLWKERSQDFQKLSQKFYELLKTDISFLVRRYCATIPCYSELEIQERLQNEQRPEVLQKLLQNPASKWEGLEERFLSKQELPEQIEIPLCADKRWPREKRLDYSPQSKLAALLKEYYLQN